MGLTLWKTEMRLITKRIPKYTEEYNECNKVITLHLACALRRQKHNQLGLLSSVFLTNFKTCLSIYYPEHFYLSLAKIIYYLLVSTI